MPIVKPPLTALRACLADRLSGLTSRSAVLLQPHGPCRWVNVGISNGYGGAVGTPCPSGDGNCYVEGHQPQFFANRVILNADGGSTAKALLQEQRPRCSVAILPWGRGVCSAGDYAKPVCSGVGKTVLYNNTVYSPTGAITECGKVRTRVVAWLLCAPVTVCR